MNELVLIVEDEEDVAELLRYNLQKAGYRAVVAGDGPQALRAVQYGEPDIILLDIMLPEMDGWEVCRIIRGSERAFAIPIIMLTALGMEEARVQGLRIGADDYVTKPFSLQELLFKIRKLLDKNMIIRTLRKQTAGQDTSIRYLVHELRNSLSVIGGYASLAASKENSDPWMKHISSAADHMDRLLSDAFIMTKLENGTGSLPLESLDLAEAVEDVVGAFTSTTDTSEVSLQIVNRPGSRIWADGTALRQVLSNLISNAVKYNRRGGAVRIRFEESDNEVDIEVRDDGPGIAGDQVEKIFDKFYRCPGSERVKGAGLGLYVVKLLVADMGGRVRVTSGGDNGSAFTITFRRALGPQRLAETAQTFPAPGRPARVAAGSVRQASRQE